MIINEIRIKKFRGFHDVQFKLGSSLTAIGGQNGTQKTTLLGMISQPFSITDKNNPMIDERPLCGGNFKSAFSEKFKLSDKFDVPKSHEWTLCLNNGIQDLTLESILRREDSGKIRFWKKGDRSKGSGYIQLPVIYLSLSRLFPIGEDSNLDASNNVCLNPDEIEFYVGWHNKILCLPDLEITQPNYLQSRQKNTLGANTNYYDWKMNSAGQDNIGKILLAILSFRRLQKNHAEHFKGGMLVIDELDATLYPASQLMLVEALRKFASNYKIQVVFTTHSLMILKEICQLQSNSKILGQNKVVYLEKVDKNILIIDDLSFESISHKLNVTAKIEGPITKIPVFVEDNEGKIFAKALLKRRATHLKFIDCSMGCGNYIQLSTKKISSFIYPNSIIILDGDVRTSKQNMKLVSSSKNILVLPMNDSPERLIAEFLYNLPDSSLLWKNCAENYNKQVAFKHHTFEDIIAPGNREKAKEWFNQQAIYWGRGCAVVINAWAQEHKEDVDKFYKDFDAIFNGFAKELSIKVRSKVK